MSMRRFLVALGAGLLVLACAESTAPPIEPPPFVAGAGPRHLRWKATPSRPHFIAHPTPPSGSSQGLLPAIAFDAGGSPGGPFTASFWAVAGETRSVTIEYTEGDDEEDETYPFAQLVVPGGALVQLPDGTPIAPGDSVFITATVDPDFLIVNLQPGGLVFSAADPAQLWLWYAGADQDFDGDGDLDSIDSYIEGELLTIWYHQAPEDPWTIIEARHFEGSQVFKIDLQHFSGYAVSY